MKRSFDPLTPPKVVGDAWKNEFHVFHWLYHLIGKTPLNRGEG
jgi:hypothetical protein